MELWIRSQDKTALIKSEDIRLYYMKANAPDNETEIWLKDRDVPVAVYESKKRALEVLDEIQSKIKQQFLCKPNPTLSCKDIERAEDVLNLKYKQDFIMEPPGIDIEPINISTIVYEMPEK